MPLNIGACIGTDSASIGRCLVGPLTISRRWLMSSARSPGAGQLDNGFHTTVYLYIRTSVISCGAVQVLVGPVGDAVCGADQGASCLPAVVDVVHPGARQLEPGTALTGLGSALALSGWGKGIIYYYMDQIFPIGINNQKTVHITKYTLRK